MKLEVLTADGPALAKQIQAKLTEAELKAYYDAHKADFAVVGTLPTDLFKGDPEAKLTPPIYTPFPAVKDALAASMAKERAQEQITETFDKISKVVDDAADDYQRAVDENAEAKAEGTGQTVAVPIPKPIDDLAKQNGLAHEVTPMLARAGEEIRPARRRRPGHEPGAADRGEVRRRRLRPQVAAL